MTDPEIVALCERFRARARIFMREASKSANPRDIARLAGMASTLEWTARELCFCADIKLIDDNPPAKDGDT